MSEHPLLETLNPQQKIVVQSVKGPVLVLAGAGSGKTKALTHRIAYLISEGLANPSEIMAVTFTNKAAREMRERVANLLGSNSVRPNAIGTFHSLGARMLREHATLTTRSTSFSILDSHDSEQLIKRALAQLNLTVKEWNPSGLKQTISKLKNQYVSPETAAATASSLSEETKAKIYAIYQNLLKQTNAYDFDDLLVETVNLLSGNPNIRALYQQRWRFLSVDEYQDTNDIQEKLLHLLLGPEKNMCVVGDDYQAIYSWRGAKVDHILRFEQQFPGCTTVYLTQNYRSTPPILKAANQVIAENQEQKHKELWTKVSEGKPVRVISLASDRHEAVWVRQQLQEHIDAGGSAGDCVVLYRTNAQSRLFEEQFIMHRIPYTIVGGFRFYDRAEVKDALSFLHLWTNPHATVALNRLARSFLKGVGAKTIAKLEAQAQASNQAILELVLKGAEATGTKSSLWTPIVNAWQGARQQTFPTVAELLRYLIEKSGYAHYLQKQPDGEERWANIEELYNVAALHTDPFQFVEETSLLSDIDTISEQQASVTCMTLHAAKGLEFSQVYLVGCEEGLLPHGQSTDSSAGLEEERRLLYVGMTRARHQLTLTHASTRFVRGELLPQLPSRFLRALPLEVERSGITQEETLQSPSIIADFHLGIYPEDKSGEPVLSEYETGDFMQHKTFGQGVVIQTNGNLVTCVFPGYGVKTIDATLIPRP